ncbi:MAG TPA: hypothetical protein VN516_04795, partial [Candidatus Baltobacteraceae bacterium]|nr:hypothetical protein [Candidatus Baltobacteraceae bacterium]
LLGASPRGSLGLFRMAQAVTAIAGKDSVSIELVKSLAQIVLAHRLIVRKEEKFRNVNVTDVVAEIVSKV